METWGGGGGISAQNENQPKYDVRVYFSTSDNLILLEAFPDLGALPVGMLCT